MTSINDPLIEMERKDNTFPYDAEELANIFDPDERKDLQEGTDVSQALYKLVNTYGGTPALAQKLGSDPQRGLQESTEQLQERARVFGENKKKPKKIRTLCELILECFDDFILRVLIVAAIFQLFAGLYEDPQHGWMESAAILMAIVIIVTVTSSQNYAKEKQFQALVAKQDEATAIVVRNGERMTINADDLLVGDVIVIECGKAAPADCVLLSSNEVVANESTMTGEPDDLHKTHVTEENFHDNPNYCLLQTTMILNGEGTALVLAVGKQTRAGRAESTLDIEDELTPLQEKLERIANEIGKAGVFVALATMIVLLIRMIIEATHADENSKWDASMYITEILEAVIIAVTVIVVAVPEGLPLAVTIALVVSVMKMFEKHNLVRKLSASETMGGANEICTDKTGTLTQNNMTVMGVYMEGGIVEGSANSSFTSASSHQQIIDSVIYNVSAGYAINVEKGTEELEGNVTECGMLKYLNASGVDVKAALQEKAEKQMKWKIPFNSARKRATAAYIRDDGNIRVYCKGAPEIVIQYCTKIHSQDGVSSLEQSKRDSICGDEVVKTFAKKCWRTMLVSYADYTPDQWASLEAQHNGMETEADRAAAVENNLTVGCIFGLMDPLRPGIKDAVIQCHKSGINVRMCTGDNIDTATAISLEAGLITQEMLDEDDDLDPLVCMTGKNFRERIEGIETTELENGAVRKSLRNMKEFKRLKPHLKVLARSSPEDKFMLVTGLMETGDVVAVTGDGTNDVPALNKADVGFAMGIAGTDPAKDAADIVLTDDDFTNILVAVMYGRNIYDNVRKFLQFQLTVNVVAMFIVFSGAAIFAEAPLTAVQMLWVNMIMDTFAALALATEPPAQELFDRPPQSRSEFIVNPVMWRNLLGQSFYQIVILLVLLFVGPTMDDYCYPTDDVNQPCFQGEIHDEPMYWTQDYYNNPDYASITLAQDAATPRLYLFTMVFQAFVFMQIFNQVNARKLGEREFNVFKGFFNNCWFLLITLIEVGMQMFIVEYGGQFVQCAPLNTQQNIICVIIGAFSLIWGLVLKFVPARWFERLSINQEPMTEEEIDKSVNATLRKSFTQSARKMNAASGSQNTKNN